MSDLYWLVDEQMARLEPFFPRSHGRPRVDNRRVLSGIIFVNRNGLRWTIWLAQDVSWLIAAMMPTGSGTDRRKRGSDPAFQAGDSP